MHRESVLGVPPPPGKAGQYNPEQVHAILLVVLDPEVAFAHEYLADGTVTFTVRAQPRAVFRIPVPDMNRVMRQDGQARGRWLVDLEDIPSECLVRGTLPAGEIAGSHPQNEDLTGGEG
jgi:hypothetical protein